MLQKDSKHLLVVLLVLFFGSEPVQCIPSITIDGRCIKPELNHLVNQTNIHYFVLDCRQKGIIPIIIFVIFLYSPAYYFFDDFVVRVLCIL
jgi:hypothetical protein